MSNQIIRMWDPVNKTFSDPTPEDYKKMRIPNLVGVGEEREFPKETLWEKIKFIIKHMGN